MSTPLIVYDADIDTVAVCCTTSDCLHGVAWLSQDRASWASTDGVVESSYPPGVFLTCPFCGCAYELPAIDVTILGLYPSVMRSTREETIALWNRHNADILKNILQMPTEMLEDLIWQIDSSIQNYVPSPDHPHADVVHDFMGRWSIEAAQEIVRHR